MFKIINSIIGFLAIVYLLSVDYQEYKEPKKTSGIFCGSCRKHLK